MNIIKIIALILRLITIWVSAKLERDKVTKQKKEEAIKEISGGIKNNDPSSITAGFNKLNRLRNK